MIDMHAIIKESTGNWRYVPVAHEDNVRDGRGINIIGSSGNYVYITKNAEGGDRNDLYLPRIHQNKRIKEGWC